MVPIPEHQPSIISWTPTNPFIQGDVMSQRSFDSPNHDDCPKFRVRHIATSIHAQERRTYTSQCNFGNLIHISCM